MSVPTRPRTSTKTSSSSTHSRTRASTSLSPGSTFPPGNSQRPANSGGSVRAQASTRPCWMIAAPTMTRGVGTFGMHEPSACQILTELKALPSLWPPDVGYVAIDRACSLSNTGDTKRNKGATRRPQASNGCLGGVPMIARRRTTSSADYLSDAFALLAGWRRDGEEINRTLRIDDAQHAALTERITIIADALGVRPTHPPPRRQHAHRPRFERNRRTVAGRSQSGSPHRRHLPHNRRLGLSLHSRSNSSGGTCLLTNRQARSSG